ncbi:MAG: hypothetical protein ACI3V5_10425, partial [Faecousia sp.]
QFVMQKIAQNGGMYQQMLMMQQQMLQLAQLVDQSRGTNLAGQIAAGITGSSVPPSPEESAGESGAKGSGAEKGGESGITKNARQRVAEASVPR